MNLITNKTCISIKPVLLLGTVDETSLRVKSDEPPPSLVELPMIY